MNFSLYKPVLFVTLAAVAAGAGIGMLRDRAENEPAAYAEAASPPPPAPVMAPPETAIDPPAGDKAALPVPVVRKQAHLAHHPAVRAPLRLSRGLAASAPAAAGGSGKPGDSGESPPPVGPSAAPVPVARATPPAPAAGDGSDRDRAEKAPPAFTYGLGVGAERYPRWLGAAQSKTISIPYLSFNWQDRVEFSTVDGLVVDLIHGERWHGGLVGTLIWGRSGNDLGPLANRLATRSNTLQAGGYLEYAVTKELSLGARLRHDIQPTGAAYADLYADLDLPAPGPVEHSVKVALEAMNRAAMDRFFGLPADNAGRLGVPVYRPGGGWSQVVATYQAFVPTSEHTGFALGASYGKLVKGAGESPLVRNFGSPTQRNFMAAFVVHY